jgi:coenzyme F420-dependent glucose-6-phosphate dehydrogenase
MIKFGSSLLSARPDKVSAVEKAGFDSIWVYDHFAPFSHQSGLRNPETGGGWGALPILPLVLANTTRCTVGTNVLCPTLRYHPAIIAQYFAQLDCLFPGRIIVGVGAGEAVNETPIVGRFPPYKERMERLEEAVGLMGKLWTSKDYFNHEGRYYKSKNLFLYAKPKEKIPVVISAFGEKSAELAGKVGDGITIYWTRPQRRDLILRRFAEGATKAGKDPETMTKAAYFPFLGITSDPLPIVRNIKPSLVRHIHEDDPRKIDELAKTLSDEEALQYCTLVPIVDDLIGVFDSAFKAGINHIIMRDLTPTVIQNKLAPPEAAGWPLKVLPYLREKYN